MSNKSFLLGSICVAALALATPALADGAANSMTGFSSTLSADYDNINIQNGGGGNGDVWGGNAEGAFGLGDSGASFQVDGGYHQLSASGNRADLWNIDASLFALVNKGGRIGATYGYDSTSGAATGHVSNYGLFGDWWASDMLTVSGKAGGFDGNGVNGYYGSGTLKGYYMPDLSLAGSIDYAHANNNGDATAYTAAVEYLVSETTPISIGGGYTYTNLAGVHANTWFLQLKFYCDDGSNGSTLVGHQRGNSTLGSDVGFGGLLTRF